MLNTSNKRYPQYSGFTLVELLIVIVVIAILAAIGVVAYNGLSNRADESAVKAGLSETAKRLEVDKVDRGAYTSSLDDLLNSTSSSGNVAYQYTGTGDGYCLTASKGSVSYHIQSGSANQTQGACTGHNDPANPPAPAEIAHQNISTFNLTTVSGGNTTTIPINYNLGPTDFVFILMNATYRTTLSMTSPGGQPITKIYNKSMGASGYQQLFAFTGTGMTGPQNLTANVCWQFCGTGGWGVSAVYIVYVIKGIGTNPTITATDTPFGNQPGGGNTISPARQPVGPGDMAIFTYDCYCNNLPTLADNSSPAQTWTTDSLRSHPNNTANTAALTALHLFPSSSADVSHQLTMGGGTTYSSSTLFTLKKNS